MTGKHRAAGERTKRLAVVGAATATVTALTVGAAAPQPVQTRPELRLVHDQPLHLTASTSLFPKPGELTDITGGLGNTVYNEAQDLYATLAKALVGRLSVPALTGGLHINIGDVLNQIPVDLLDQVLGAVKIDLGSLLDGALPAGVSDALVGVLDLLNITDSAGNVSLSALLGLIGLDVSNIVDLANTDVAGVKIITPGPTFGLLKMLGLDIGWTPGTPQCRCPGHQFDTVPGHHRRQSARHRLQAGQGRPRRARSARSAAAAGGESAARGDRRPAAGPTRRHRRAHSHCRRYRAGGLLHRGVVFEDIE